MILMESATFLMGGNDGNESGPTFLVSVPAFYLSKVETTQKLGVESDELQSYLYGLSFTSG